MDDEDGQREGSGCGVCRASRGGVLSGDGKIVPGVDPNVPEALPGVVNAKDAGGRKRREPGCDGMLSFHWDGRERRSDGGRVVDDEKLSVKRPRRGESDDGVLAGAVCLRPRTARGAGVVRLGRRSLFFSFEFCPPTFPRQQAKDLRPFNWPFSACLCVQAGWLPKQPTRAPLPVLRREMHRKWGGFVLEGAA